MPLAILIGFEYTHNRLPGAIIDLYHADRWARSSGCQINLIMDRTCGSDPDLLCDAYAQNIIETDQFEFDPKTVLRIQTRAALSLALTTLLSQPILDQKLIIYYSGHGAAESMILPDQSLLPFVEFRDLILNLIEPYTEIFWILDCCNPNGLHLPYKLHETRFRLVSTPIECITHPSILITSSNWNQKSVATRFGSVFTLHLFRFLTRLRFNVRATIDDTDSISHSLPRSKNRNLSRMVSHLESLIQKMKTGCEQTISIYSAYMIDPVLWLWIGSGPQTMIPDIVTDPTLSFLIIRPPPPASIPRALSINPYDLEYAV